MQKKLAKMEISAILEVSNSIWIFIYFYKKKET